MDRAAELALLLDWGLIEPHDVDPIWAYRAAWYRLGVEQRKADDGPPPGAVVVDADPDEAIRKAIERKAAAAAASKGR